MKIVEVAGVEDRPHFENRRIPVETSFVGPD
jgi:hypothetical protein